MGWLPGQGDGAGDGPVPGIPPGFGSPGSDEGAARDPRLPGFARGGEWDTAAPSAALAVALEAASGPGWSCPGASRDELAGLLHQWQVLESWAAAGKLGVLRALVRDDDQPLPGGGYRGDLPEGWTRSLTHEVALALSMPAVSAERLMWLAWNLEGLLPATGELLAAGDLTLAKARAVDTALNLLRPEDAAQAEAMIAGQLPGKTYGQVQQLAANAALAVDPEAGTRRRRDAERHKSRVTLFREETGAAGLSGRDLPTDQALAAHASVCSRAQEYRDSGAFPGDTRMDQYRAAAYLDLLNGIPAEARIAAGLLVTAGPDDAEASVLPSRDDRPGHHNPGHDDPDDGWPGGPVPGGAPGSSASGGNPARARPAGGSGDGPRDDAGPGSPGGSGPGPGRAPRLADLVIPLATLLGLAERPGEGHGLGPLDPALCRELAAAAADSPWTRLCLTVTEADGIAIAHGCAKPARRPKPKTVPAGKPAQAPPVTPGHSAPLGNGAALALPARVNLTVTATRLAELAAAGPPGPSGTGPPGTWRLTSHAGDPGPPGGYGTWTLTLPDGRQLTVRLEPVPTLACDHGHETPAYQPGDALRHLVQVRDGTCTFPPCSRHARESDFEHATPYDKGGRTCACNAGARSRACHQVKQSPGWKVTQPKPGWHRWQTPAGRTYTQGPKHYPF
jgi:hypothetical protein